MRIAVGDIGGTHARFAIAELAPGAPPILGPMHKYRTSEHAGLASAWAAFRQDQGGAVPDLASLAVAAPIVGDVLDFPNSNWTIDCRTLAGDLGLSRLHLLNDFGAVAHAVSALPEEAFVHLAGPAAAPQQDGLTTVLGPGTGLGVALILRRAGRVEVIETEAAHIAFAPQDEREERIERSLRARYGRCSVERVVSGPGLVDLYAALGGPIRNPADAGALWQGAIDRSDLLASQALDILIAAFGAAAGDISLAHGSMQVVITGGLANRMSDQIRAGAFHARFVDKGRYRARQSRIAIHLATEPEPGLIGAAIAFQRSLPA